MVAYDPHHNVFSSEAGSVRNAVNRLADSDLDTIYRETFPRETTTPSRARMVTAISQAALRNRPLRLSVEERLRRDRDYQRDRRAQGGTTL